MIGDELDIDDGFRFNKETLVSIDKISIEHLELICIALNGAFLQSKDKRYTDIADTLSLIIEVEEDEQRESFMTDKFN